MDLGLNVAAAGMLAEQVREDQLANDLANASTPGYKPESSETQSFGSMLLENTSTGQQIGTIDTGVEVMQGKADLAQGPIEQTGGSLDFAITGSGFFAVKTADGVQYTRDGEFQKNAQGLLVDDYGDEVLSASGQPIKVGSDGTVPASALGVFNVTNATELGDNNFTGTASGLATGATVQSGALEESGIEPVDAMTDMEAALNAYTAGQQSISTISNTLQESAQTVGSIPG